MTSGAYWCYKNKQGVAVAVVFYLFDKHKIARRLALLPELVS